jgi:hypothetical protein
MVVRTLNICPGGRAEMVLQSGRITMSRGCPFPEILYSWHLGGSAGSAKGEESYTGNGGEQPRDGASNRKGRAWGRVTLARRERAGRRHKGRRAGRKPPALFYTISIFCQPAFVIVDQLGNSR